ncbi:sensor histidine kinase [Streptomyces sp. NPDC127098]|uniref:sensor histidine kinase n=1 Tax=Streptomyces sp. NPDC127098 TaxID=3347137 RepID=UPI00365FCEC5
MFPGSETRAGRLLAGARRQGVLLSRAFGGPEPGEALFARAPKPWMRLLPHFLALAASASLLPTTVVVLLGDYGLPGVLAGLLGVGQAAPLLLAGARPLSAWYVVFSADVLTALALPLWGGPLDGAAWPWPAPTIVGYLLLCLPLSLHLARRTLVAVWLSTAAAAVLVGLLRPGHSPGSSVLLVVLSGVVLLLGGAIRERSEAQRRLAEQETISEAERSHRRLLEERARIARELHDVVAHHMSVISVQADSAPYRVEGVPEAARAEFTTIADTARQSLAEMRRLLGVLRSEGTEAEGGGAGPELAPQPGLGELGTLVESAVRAGVAARLTVTGEPAGLPRAVTLNAYRIVQEALANVVRHAPGAEAAVTVALSADGSALRVEVVNGPPATPARPLEWHGTGHGLIGMRERTRLLGGTLDTGPTAEGGFRVAAVLPRNEPAPGENA